MKRFTKLVKVFLLKLILIHSSREKDLRVHYWHKPSLCEECVQSLLNISIWKNRKRNQKYKSSPVEPARILPVWEGLITKMCVGGEGSLTINTNLVGRSVSGWKKYTNSEVESWKKINVAVLALLITSCVSRKNQNKTKTRVFTSHLEK